MSVAVGLTAAERRTGGAEDAQPDHPPRPRLAFRVQPPTLPCRGGVRQPLLACPAEMRLPPPTCHAGAATPQRTGCRAAAAVDGRQPPSPRLTRQHGRHTRYKRLTHALSRHRYITNTTHTHTQCTQRSYHAGTPIDTRRTQSHHERTSATAQHLELHRPPPAGLHAQHNPLPRGRLVPCVCTQFDASVTTRTTEQADKKENKIEGDSSPPASVGARPGGGRGWRGGGGETSGSARQ